MLTCQAHALDAPHHSQVVQQATPAGSPQTCTSHAHAHALAALHHLQTHTSSQADGSTLKSSSHAHAHSLDALHHARHQLIGNRLFNKHQLDSCSTGGGAGAELISTCAGGTSRGTSSSATDSSTSTSLTAASGCTARCSRSMGEEATIAPPVWGAIPPHQQCRADTRCATAEPQPHLCSAGRCRRRRP